MANRIGEVVGQWAATALSTVRPDDRHAAATQLTAQLLAEIDRLHPDAVDPGQQPTDPIQRLIAIEPLDPTGDPIPIRRPITPLRDTVLMTNARDQPSVGREIAAEIESADRIDVVMAFIRWTGIRDLLAPLRRHVEQGKPLHHHHHYLRPQHRAPGPQGRARARPALPLHYFGIHDGTDLSRLCVQL
jgi:hypothetical protein